MGRARRSLSSRFAGCGGSSKPSYCSKTADLKQSVQDLGSVNIIQGGTSALTTALSTVETNAQAVVSSAKSDFPDETAAINSSISALKQSAQQLARVADATGRDRKGAGADQRRGQLDSGLHERYESKCS